MLTVYSRARDGDCNCQALWRVKFNINLGLFCKALTMIYKQSRILEKACREKTSRSESFIVIALLFHIFGR
jgi:hypothetical protein